MNVNYAHQIANNVQIMTCVYHARRDISYSMEFVDNANKGVRNAPIKSAKNANILK